MKAIGKILTVTAVSFSGGMAAMYFMCGKRAENGAEIKKEISLPAASKERADTLTWLSGEVLAADSAGVTCRLDQWVDQEVVARFDPRVVLFTDSMGAALHVVAAGKRVTVQAAAVPTYGVLSRKGKLAGAFRAHVTRAIDGDTFEAVVDVMNGVTVATHIRIKGIDTPEKGKRAKCDAEAALALQASAFTKSMIEGRDVMLTGVIDDKYGGRFVADVRTLDGKSVGQALIGKGFARAYDGGTKSSWCR